MIQEFETPKRLAFSKRVHRYGTVYSYFFIRIDEFSFLAGQNARVVIPHLDGEECMRSLSFANAPYEEEVEFSLHIRDESQYKKACMELVEGDEVHIVKIKGNTILPGDSHTPVVMIAGGIGITPFRSILLHTAHEGVANPMELIHIARDTFLYEEELAKLDTPQRRGGREDLKLFVEEAVAKYSRGKFLLAGPPAFIEASTLLLEELEIKEDQIAFSRFKNYEGLLG